MEVAPLFIYFSFFDFAVLLYFAFPLYKTYQDRYFVALEWGVFRPKWDMMDQNEFHFLKRCAFLSTFLTVVAVLLSNLLSPMFANVMTGFGLTRRMQPEQIPKNGASYFYVLIPAPSSIQSCIVISTSTYLVLL